jgi:hypothetical protein
VRVAGADVPQEKLIGESQHVQNNPPKFVPNESL